MASLDYKSCLRKSLQLILEDLKKKNYKSDQLSWNVLKQIQKILGNLNGTDQKQSYNIPPVKNKVYEWTKEANLKCYIFPRTVCHLFSV